VKLARGAWPIVEARRRGERPEAPVIVSFVGPVRALNPVVRVEPGADEWGFLADLDVFLFVRPETVLHHDTLLAIVREAANVDVWDVEREMGFEVYPVWEHPLHREMGFDLEVRRVARLARFQPLLWTVASSRKFAGFFQ
jgi:hypothetical protein